MHSSEQIWNLNFADKGRKLWSFSTDPIPAFFMKLKNALRIKRNTLLMGGGGEVRGALFHPSPPISLVSNCRSIWLHRKDSDPILPQTSSATNRREKQWKTLINLFYLWDKWMSPNFSGALNHSWNLVDHPCGTCHMLGSQRSCEVTQQGRSIAAQDTDGRLQHLPYSTG